MSVRTRLRVTLVLYVAAAFALAWIGKDWADVALYGAGAGFMALTAMPIIIWVERAHDGDLRRRPRD
jgi:membrane protease YdiL (CAAX protease family)